MTKLRHLGGIQFPLFSYSPNCKARLGGSEIMLWLEKQIPVIWGWASGSYYNLSSSLLGLQNKCKLNVIQFV